ncbi:NAD(P)-binding protein [Jaminaea rosea]|uniref:NAD(P)-binding protein n=1 Tax=Jaminaea rosea TaxID=1569628 RepID=A0A316ULX4_9BASI|nr:NAD(P)-binding protein [Jaminaea rosea]PWN25381.1 NAD(P)-binding protein [Jaminaea rosea]
MPASTSSAAAKGYESTLRRLEHLQSHLTRRPRSGRVSGYVCIVTGAGSPTGIGRASVLHLAHEGAKHIYALDFDGSNFEDLKDKVKERYPEVKVTTMECDAADEESIKGIVERAMKEEGRLDVFFANAAIVGNPVPVGMLDAEDVAETMRVNVASCFLAVKHASTAMQVTSAAKPDPNGSIILTASVAGLRSGAGSSDYSASKAAVISLAQTSAWQLSRTGVRVNALCPGLIETGMTKVVFDAARERGTAGKIGQLNPMGRYGVAEEIANALMFLASDEASYVNGIALPVCGGLSAGHPVVPGKMN